MMPGYDCAASVLLCAEDNAAVLGLDEEGEESSWPAGATPPRDAAAGGVAVEGYLTDFRLQSDDCIEALVEREEGHMPADGYLQKLHRRHGGLDLGAIRKDAIDWIWKVIEHYNFAPLTAVLAVNYLDRFLSTYEFPVSLSIFSISGSNPSQITCLMRENAIQIMAGRPSLDDTTFTRPATAVSSFHQCAAKHLQQVVTLAQRNGVSRRCLLTLLTSTAAIPDGSESRKALLQEYLKKSKENKEKNDKERLDDYYKRSYKDYFGLIEGEARQKKADELTESEKRILEWLDKNN